jgi:hypothetical protein
MKIFLHIGMPKTGSTTIQRTLLLNKRRLAKAGVYYPYRTNTLYGLVTGTEPGPPLIVPKRCHTVIISDERLFNRVRSPAHAEMIANKLREISQDIKVISYVRRQDEVFVSAYFTRLLMGSSQKLQDLPLNPVQTYKRLSSWNEPFGVENMIVRRFGRSYLPDGLIPDFTKAVGIDHLPIEQAPVANSSPRCDVLEIIRRLNASRGESELDRESLKAVARAVGFAEPVGLSARDRETLIDESADQNRKLSECYFGGQRVFDHAVPDNQPPWPSIGIGDLGKIAGVMAQMHGIQIGRPPGDLELALDWMRTIAATCARTPKGSRWDNTKAVEVAASAVEDKGRTAVRTVAARAAKTRSVKDSEISPARKQQGARSSDCLVFNENRAFRDHPRTILCVGLAHSGTNGVASLLEFLGVWLGAAAQSVNRQNKALIRALREDADNAKRLIAEYDERLPVWGLKAPAARNELAAWLPLFRNPLIVVPHRDVVGRVGRQSKGGGHNVTQQSLRRSIVQECRLLEALETIAVPQLHVSFSLLTESPEKALAIISEFAGLPVPKGDVRAYLKQARARRLGGVA